MNEAMKPDALLEAAAALVQRALAQLDVGESACVTCSARRFRNKDHARVYENLSAVPSRLRHASAKLQGRDYSVGTMVDGGANAAQEGR
jgi:hypothetical protein